MQPSDFQSCSPIQVEMEIFFHDTYALWVALVAYNYHRRWGAYDQQTSLSGHVSPFCIGVLKTSTTFAFDIINCSGGRMHKKILA